MASILLALILWATPVDAAESWLKSSGFGLMFHYECFKEKNSRDFNKAVDSFDVERFADAVASTRAGHVIFTIGQHTGKFCAPNAAYEKLLGVKNGEWTSRRDLILEIAKALERRGIRLIIYMTARAPMRHYRVIAAMGDTLPTINGKPAGPKVNPMSHPRKLKGFRRSENQAPNPVFLKNWGDVCGEWSRRYGKRVSGWWFDGYKDEMKAAYEPLQKERHNIDTWLAAVRAGNPAAELAFNAGAHPLLSLCTRGKLCPLQTFTAGEQREFTFKNKPLTPKNFPAPEGVTWHLLLSVSDGWGAGTKSRFDAATLAERIGIINAQDGTVTLDVPITANGAIPKAVLTTLQKLGQRRTAKTFKLEKPLTVLNYNVFNGFRGGRSYKPTVAWVNTVKPDIAAWQELVGWNEARLKKAANDWHHPHAATLKGGGYNIGITSRTPIEVIARNTKGFHHGYLHCRTAGIDVIVCHLWPAGVRQQLGEADQLRDLVRRLAKEGRQVILMGDFNAHAATDKPWLDKQQPLLDRRKVGDAKKRPEDRFIVDGKYIFPIMNRILEAPLHDLVHERFATAHPKPTPAEALQLGSFPTRVLGHVKTPELQRGFLERIDFILTTPALAKHCTSAKVCREPKVLETISDHYPVVAIFKPNPHAETQRRGEKK